MIPQQYIINEAIIRSNRVDFELDIAKSIIDISLYESIHKPYATGTITMVDDATIFETIDFRGTEEIDLKIEIKDTGYTLERTFVISTIKKTTPTNDKSNLLLLQLLDVHAFKDSLKKVSKSYTGKLEDIVTQIILDEFELGVDRSYMADYPSIQAPLRVIPPYLSPLQACNWLKSRATTVNGSPFYLCASLFDEKLRLGNFDSMMTRPIFNEDAPLTYASTQTNFTDTFYNVNNAFVVTNLKRFDEFNTYELIQNSGLAANVAFHDIQRGTTVEQHYSIRQQLATLQEQGVLPQSQQLVFDDKIDHDSAPAKQIHNFICSSTYKDARNYHDAFSQADIVANVQSMALNQALERNKLMISIPGLTIFAKQVSVGDRLRLNILDTSMERQGDIDTMRSGDYLILEARHIFLDTEFYVNLTIAKLNALEE